MLDHYLYGQVSRISPEAPVPVVNHQNESFRLGGAANLALNLRVWESRPAFAPVGEDDAGAMVTRLARESLSYSHLIPFQGVQRPKKLELSTKSANPTIDRETNENVSPNGATNSLTPLKSHFDADIPPQIILLSDYDKGLLDAELTLSNHRAISTVLSPLYSSTPKGMTSPNTRGQPCSRPISLSWRDVSGTPCDSDNTLESVAKELRRELELDVARGYNGAAGLLMVRDDTINHYPAQTQEVFDVSGAGDTALAAIAAGTLAKISPDRTMKFANSAPQELFRSVGPPRSALSYSTPKQNKISNLESSHLDRNVADLLEKWAAKTSASSSPMDVLILCTLGTSNFEFAKAQGDILIVGLNSDASVKRLKGSNRPLKPERQSTYSSSSECVDLVITFDQDTPLELIQELRPNILVKGADYLNQEIVGQDEVESWGGEVKLCPLADGYSTTKKVSEIAGRE